MKHKILFGVLMLALVSCRSPKELLYFQDIENYQEGIALTEYEQTIKKDDQLQIIVTAPNAEVAAPYNLIRNAGSGGGGYISYLVDAKGDIDFPILGSIHVEGLTREQLVDYLTEKLKIYIEQVLVVVNFEGYKITILGAVGSPGVYHFTEEKVSILQALASAGDVTSKGRRDNVLLLREIDGKQMPIRFDLRKSDMFSADFYFLEQNDVLYVEPVKYRLVQEDLNANLSFGTMLLSVLTTIVTTVLLFVKL